MRRVSIVGSSGSGKSTMGPALASVLGVPFHELDSFQHLAHWTPAEPGEFLRQVDEITSGDGWVIDGNYADVVVEGPVWERADTVVWLDVPKRVAMWQVTRRTIGRAFTRRELWNGNREQWSNIVSWDPERSMIRWVWTTHASVRARYERLSSDPARRHVTFVRLRSRAEMDRWMADVSRRLERTGTD